jgi:asparagine synthase (glutamine-hydrolysing)
LTHFAWSGDSDTETLLACIEFWGLQKTLAKLEGMFAFALWDSKDCSLYLVRDRMGEKPLYYGWQGDSFVFGSELKSLKAHPAFKANLDKRSLDLYFRYNYIPAPYSIYKGISKLHPGSVLLLRQGEARFDISSYWSIEDRIITSKLNPIVGDDVELADRLDCQLRKSIKQKMESDVPLGAFLSGGIDSSIVVGIMQSLSRGPVKTFTIGFEDAKFNEAEDAKMIAKHLGTSHHEFYISAQDVIDAVPLMSDIYDEPFSDASQIPTYLVSKLAKQEVTVSLSGDGGDELFCGYNRYHLTKRVWNKISKLPLIVRKYIATFLLFIPVHMWNKLEVIPYIGDKYNNLGLKIHKGAKVLSSNSLMELYENLLSNWKISDKILLDEGGYFNKNLSPIENLGKLSDIEKMMLWDAQSYLPDDILVKLDRASMACSLEGRVPFLDHNLIEFSWKIPEEYKYKKGKGKWILRQVLYKYLPKEIVDRPKSGFTLPLADLLRADLKAWAEKLINTERLKSEGILDAEVVMRKWDEHQSMKSDWSNQLWSVLMFQLWLERNA